jgi:hypothetical protein
MAPALLKTRTSKKQTSVRNESQRLKAREKTSEGPRNCLRVPIEREGKPPRVALCGGLSLKRRKHPVSTDQRFIP